MMLTLQSISGICCGADFFAPTDRNASRADLKSGKQATNLLVSAACPDLSQCVFRLSSQQHRVVTTRPGVRARVLWVAHVSSCGNVQKKSGVSFFRTQSRLVMKKTTQRRMTVTAAIRLA